MLRITIELISAVDGHHEILGEALIYNDGTGTSTRGNYKAIFGKKRQKFETLVKNRNTSGYTPVTDFPRKQLRSWDLLYRALRDTFGWRNQ